MIIIPDGALSNKISEAGGEAGEAGGEAGGEKLLLIKKIYTQIINTQKERFNKEYELFLETFQSIETLLKREDIKTILYIYKLTGGASIGE